MKREKKMLARYQELLEWGKVSNELIFSWFIFFSTCTKDFAKKEQLLVVVVCYRRLHLIKSCSLVLKRSYRLE